MIYRIDYQYITRNKLSPDLNRTVTGDEFESSSGLALVPNVGDFVCLAKAENIHVIQGVVQSRVFSYLESKDRQSCVITLMLKEADKNSTLYGH